MPTSVLAVSHMGYLTGAPEKRAYLVNPGSDSEFVLHCLETRYFSGEKTDKECYCPDVFRGEIKVVGGDFGPVGIMDFSPVKTPGLYQIIVGGRRSHPFFIRKDLYLRTAYEAFLYSHIQRCGDSVEGWHQACHRDDGVRDDTGESVDCIGGWHDAGDLRKLVNHTMWHAIGMLWAKRTWGVHWHQYSDDDILDELKWGNQFYLKVKDPGTHIVWSDVGASELDNTWTDGLVGTGDDRMIRTRRSLMLQYKYAWMQAMISRAFSGTDREYGMMCLQAGIDAYRARAKFRPSRDADTLAVSYWLLASLELYRATGDGGYLLEAREAMNELLDRQHSGSDHSCCRESRNLSDHGDQGCGESVVKGFFYDDRHRTEVFNDWWQGCMLPFALIAAMEVFGGAEQEKVSDAVRMYLDGFIVPLSERNAFGAIPVYYGIGQAGAMTHDLYRRISGKEVYRYFLPAMSGIGEAPAFRQYGQGTNTHLLGSAAVLFRCHRIYGVDTYKILGLRLLEWVHGANPLGICMVTGRSAETRYPHSRYLGLIHGAIQNGLTGDELDEPRFGGANYDCEWQTLEYWSPTQAQYIMSVCELHPEYSLQMDIGIRHGTDAG